MTKFSISNKLIKTLFLVHFGPIFQIFGENKFSRKIRLSRPTSHGILAPCQISEKTDKVPGKRLDRRTGGRKEGQDGHTLFYRTLPATARGPINRCDI